MNKQKLKQYGLVLLLLGAAGLKAQVLKLGDNPGTAQNANSALEVESTNKGVVIPRVSLSGTTSASPLSAGAGPLTSTLVYNTASTADVTPGFYYWDGSKWVRIVTGTTGTAGTYTKVTTDAFGRVTSGSSLSASDIPSLSWGKITSGLPTTLSGYGIADGVSTSGTYNNPGWMTGLAGSKISGNITGNAANVTGTVAIANGGTGATTTAAARTALGLSIGTDIPSPAGTGASGTWGISISGNAATVTNGLYSSGSYANPSWLTSLAWSKLTGTPTTVSGYGITDALSTSRTITINGTTYDLSSNRSWSVGDVSTTGSYANPSWISSLAWSKLSGVPTTISGYGITDAVTSSRTITINGTSYDLSANRSWTVGDVTSTRTISTSGPLSGGGDLSTNRTISIAKASGSADGYLSSSDWTTFNNKENAIATGNSSQYLRGDKSWQTLDKNAVGLGNVENTALSSWTGSSNISTVGTITTGTWNGSTISVGKGGTGQTTYTDGQLLIGNSTGNTLSKATLTAGSGISITNGSGSITIAATGATASVPSVMFYTTTATQSVPATTSFVDFTNVSVSDASYFTVLGSGDSVRVLQSGRYKIIMCAQIDQNTASPDITLSAQTKSGSGSWTNITGAKSTATASSNRVISITFITNLNANVGVRVGMVATATGGIIRADGTVWSIEKIQ